MTEYLSTKLASGGLMIGKLCQLTQKTSWYLTGFFGFPPKSVEETRLRLSWEMKKRPRYVPGEFQFPFGAVRYVDVASLRSQFIEIFVNLDYEFDSACESPYIVDCGGNIGLSVIWFKRRYPESRITVFEADPDIAGVLHANIEMFNLQDVQIINAAIWDETGRVGFVSDKADSGRIVSGGAQKNVDAVRLADFITQPVDLLKLDIEGAEYAAFRDLVESGKIRKVKCLICEIHGTRNTRRDLSEILSALAGHGFSFTFNHARSAPDMPGEPEPTPFKSARDGKFLLHLYAWQPSVMG